MTILSFEPPQRLLMGPGPSSVHPRVLRALARPTIGPEDPAYGELAAEVKRLLKFVFKTRNEATMPLPGPASAGLEACIANLVEPGDRVIVCRNGRFGDEAADMVERVGARAVLVEDPWGAPVDANKVGAALRANRGAVAVAFAHGEASTGVLSDAAALCALARRHGALSIMDACATLGGTPLHVDDWGADAVFAASEHCLSAAPGLSPVTFSERAIETMRFRERPAYSRILDMELVMPSWYGQAKGSEPRSAPANALYALHEALVLLCEEGLDNAWGRHETNYQALAAGIAAMGLHFLAPETVRLPQVTSVILPAGLDEAAARRRLLLQHDIEIGGGTGELAGRIWRIGLMGQSSTAGNVLQVLGALDELLFALGAPVHRGVATPVAATILGWRPLEPTMPDEPVRLHA